MTPTKQYVVALAKSLSDNKVKISRNFEALNKNDRQLREWHDSVIKNPYYSSFPIPHRVAQLYDIRDNLTNALPRWYKGPNRRFVFEVLDIKLSEGDPIPTPEIGVFTGNRLRCLSLPIQHDNEAAILFDEFLFYIIYEIAKVISSCISVSNLSGTKVGIDFKYENALKRILNNRSILNRFSDAEKAALCGSYNLISKTPLESESSARFAYELFYSTKVFILCHELAHVYEDHFKEYLHSNELKKAINQFGNAIPYNEIQEFSADFTAIQLSSVHFGNRSKPFFVALLGAELFFAIALIAEVVFYTNTNSYDMDMFHNSHPPAIKRKKFFRMQCQEYLGHESCDTSIIIGRLFDKMFNLLFVETRASIVG